MDEEIFNVTIDRNGQSLALNFVLQAFPSACTKQVTGLLSRNSFYSNLVVQHEWAAELRAACVLFLY